MVAPGEEDNESGPRRRRVSFHLEDSELPNTFVPAHLLESVEDVEYVPTKVWTHSGDRSHVAVRMVYTMIFVLTTFISCLLCLNMILVNSLVICIARFVILLSRIDLPSKPALREFLEMSSGWCLDVGAYFVCRIMHSLGIWRLILLGPRVKWRLSNEEWLAWKVGKEKLNEDNVIMVPLPRAKASSGGDEVIDDLYCVGGSMLVSNHMSNIDGFVDKACMFPVASKALIKAGAIKAPFVGQLLWLSNQCFVWRTRNKNGIVDLDKTYARCAEVVKNNVPIVCYPEGTRRMFGRMNPFKLGMIGASVDHEWPIHVSVIHGSHRAWPPRELLVNKHPIYVKFDDHVILPRKGIDTPERIASAIRNRMLKLMLDVPGHDPIIERPLLNSSDLRKIMELAKKRNEIRNSFLG